MRTVDLRLRQIALVAKDLAAARADIAAVLGLDHAFEDPAVAHYGLGNVVFAVGTTFLEVVSPVTEGTTAGRLLDKRGGDGGYMVILQTERLAEARERILKAGARIVSERDKDGAAFTHIHPRDVGGAILSIDAMDPPERWDWGGPDWQARNGAENGLAIVAAELQGDAPEPMARRWGEVLGLGAERHGEGWRIALAGGELRFTRTKDGRGEGLRAIDIAARDTARMRAAAESRSLVGPQGEIMLSGTAVRLVGQMDGV